MTRADIDLCAFYGREMPANSGPSEIIYYYAIRSIYDNVKQERLTKEKAKQLKDSLALWLDTIISLAHSNSKLIVELGKLTAPRAELVKRDKAELLEIINRIEALVTGLISEYGDKLPGFIKMEDKQ